MGTPSFLFACSPAGRMGGAERWMVDYPCRFVLVHLGPNSATLVNSMPTGKRGLHYGGSTFTLFEFLSQSAISVLQAGFGAYSPSTLNFGGLDSFSEPWKIGQYSVLAQIHALLRVPASVRMITSTSGRQPPNRLKRTSQMERTSYETDSLSPRLYSRRTAPRICQGA